MIPITIIQTSDKAKNRYINRSLTTFLVLVQFDKVAQLPYEVQSVELNDVSDWMIDFCDSSQDSY
ncbi:192_t:CDS:2 [Cetraspora pellucida]|uniref:192_t:CDS:1 n=1 Tax=Cetraspora pellucida TaxID=1433469 RepID=A0A9N8Z6T3_9GLOM|nr:192_t:CDS:2 [Cetraspora pellucida]